MRQRRHGGVEVTGEGRWLERLLWAALLASALAVVLVLPRMFGEGGEDEGAPPARGPGPQPAPRAARPAVRAPVPAAEPPAGDAPPAGDVPPPPLLEGKSGLAAFNPPGTKPLKRGLVVPEGFALPPGYVRHYQVTDDGEALPAVLMFHPDAAPTDAQGRPVTVPADRLVPPELAPPGMPLEVLEVPQAGVAEGTGG